MAFHAHRPRRPFKARSGWGRSASARRAATRTHRAALGSLAAVVLTLGLAGAAVPALAGDPTGDPELDAAALAAEQTAAEAAAEQDDAAAPASVQAADVDEDAAAPTGAADTDSPVTAGTESIDESAPKDPAKGAPVEADGDGAQDEGVDADSRDEGSAPGSGEAAGDTESNEKAPESRNSVLPPEAASREPAPGDADAEPNSARAVQAASVGVPEGEPGSREAKLIVRASGDRTGTGVSSQSSSPLAGVTYEFYRSGSSGTTGGNLAGQCTTDATGECGLILNLTNRGGRGSNYYDYFHARAVSAPAGWTAPASWGSSSNRYRFEAGRISEGGGADSRTVELPRAYGGGSYVVGTPGSVASPRWATVRDNPGIPQQCGIDVAMVVDLSGSIGTSLGQYKTAARGFVDALTGTPSQMALYTFASDAPAAGANNSTVGLTSVASGAGPGRLKDAIAGFSLPTGDGAGTNWDRALHQVAESNENYDVVLFLTDGDPTFFRNRQGPGSSTTINEVNEAIHSANAVKAKGTAVLAIGIGISGASETRLAVMSGPTKGEDYFTTNFSGLGDLLKEKASASCKGSVSVVKNIVDANGDLIDDSPAGWEFTATADKAIIESGTGPTTSVSKVTEDGTGAVNFGLTFPTLAAENVAITETQQAGYQLRQQGGKNAVCTADGAPVSVTNAASGPGFSVNVQPTDVVTCLVQNQDLRSSLTLVKTVTNSYGGTSVVNDWTLTATGPTTGVTGKTGEAAVTGAVVSPGEYTLSESGPAGYESDGWVCRAGTTPLPVTGSKVSVPASSDVTCTVHNRDVPAKLTLVKNLVNDFGGTSVVDDWILSAEGPTAGVTGRTGAAAVTEATVTPGTYSLSESGPDGYQAGEWVCANGDDDLTVDDGTVDVPRGGDVTCTITNTDKPGSVTWTKIAGGSGAALQGSEWELRGPNGAITIKDCVADSPDECTGPDKNPAAGAFTVEELAWGDYTLVETKAPPGYQLNDSFNGDFMIDGSHLTVALGDITNDQQAGPDLPLTGGIGRDHIYIAGAAVLLLSVAALGGSALHRRRSQRSAS